MKNDSSWVSRRNGSLEQPLQTEFFNISPNNRQLPNNFHQPLQQLPNHPSPRFFQKQHRASHPGVDPSASSLRQSFYASQVSGGGEKRDESDKKYAFLSRFAAISRRKAALQLLSKPVSSGMVVELDAFRIPHVYINDNLSNRRKEVMFENNNFSILNRPADVVAKQQQKPQPQHHLQLQQPILIKRDISPNARRLASMSVGVLYPRLHQISQQKAQKQQSSLISRNTSMSIHSSSMKTHMSSFIVNEKETSMRSSFIGSSPKQESLQPPPHNLQVDASRIGMRSDDFLRMPASARTAYYKSSVFVNYSPLVFAMAASSTDSSRANSTRFFTRNNVPSVRIKKKMTATSTNFLTSDSSCVSEQQFPLNTSRASSQPPPPPPPPQSHTRRSFHEVVVDDQVEAAAAKPSHESNNVRSLMKKRASLSQIPQDNEDESPLTILDPRLLSLSTPKRRLQLSTRGSNIPFSEEIQEAEEAAEETLETRKFRRGGAGNLHQHIRRKNRVVTVADLSDISNNEGTPLPFYDKHPPPAPPQIDVDPLLLPHRNSQYFNLLKEKRVDLACHPQDLPPKETLENSQRYEAMIREGLRSPKQADKMKYTFNRSLCEAATSAVAAAVETKHASTGTEEFFDGDSVGVGGYSLLQTEGCWSAAADTLQVGSFMFDEEEEEEEDDGVLGFLRSQQPQKPHSEEKEGTAAAAAASAEDSKAIKQGKKSLNRQRINVMRLPQMDLVDVKNSPKGRSNSTPTQSSLLASMKTRSPRR